MEAEIGPPVFPFPPAPFFPHAYIIAPGFFLFLPLPGFFPALFAPFPFFFPPPGWGPVRPTFPPRAPSFKIFSRLNFFPLFVAPTGIGVPTKRGQPLRPGCFFALETPGEGDRFRLFSPLFPPGPPQGGFWGPWPPLLALVFKRFGPPGPKKPTGGFWAPRGPCPPKGGPGPRGWGGPGVPPGGPPGFSEINLF